MNEVFDLYSKQRIWYRLSGIFCLVIFVFMILLYFSPRLFVQLPVPLIVAILVMWLVVLFTMVIISFVAPQLTYIKEGEIMISLNTLVINDNLIPFNTLKKINISAHYNRSGGIDNKIEITTIDNVKVKYRYAIASREQLNDLTIILKRWRYDGVNVSSDNIDFV